jgi:hypothetical protein
VTIINSTISGNSARHGAGVQNAGDMTVRNSTVTANMAVISFIGSGPAGVSGPVTAQNTIIAGNSNSASGPVDVSGHLYNSLGNNLIGVKGDSSGWLESDLLNVNARLGPLADNGGPTMTHALLPDSPAIDAGNNTGAPPTDQRGNRRPRDGNGDGIAIVDIGAFELSLEQSRVEAVHDSATVDEDTTDNVINVLANDSGPSGSELSVVAVTQAAKGTTSMGPNGAHVLYTPNPNFVGTDTFGYTVSDGMGGAATAMVTVTVVNVDTDLQGTTGDDVFLVRRDASGANLQVFDNETAGGTPLFSAPQSSVDFLLLEGLGGDDRLIIELPHGNPIPSGGVQFVGGDHGTGGDALIIRDSGTANGTYIADTTTAGNATLTIGGRNVALTGVEPIDVFGLNSLTIVTPRAADTLSITSPAPLMTRLTGTSGALALSTVTFTNVATFVVDAATNDGAAGDDSLTISATDAVPNGFGFLQYRSGTGANTLAIENGVARIDATMNANGTLATTVEDGAQLITHRMRQTSLTLADGSRATILSDGSDAGTSVLNSLTINPGGTLDVNDNALIVDYTGASPASAIRGKIVEGRGGVGIGQGKWAGTGITSSSAQQINATMPEARSVGYAENAALPLGPYATFRGVPVDDTSILIAYTRTGDANLDGVVGDADVTVVGAIYAPGVSQPHWALGDFDYNGFVDDGDVTLVGALYDPTAAPVASPPPERTTADGDSLIDLLALSIASELASQAEPRQFVLTIV